MPFSKGDKVARRSVASEVGVVVNEPRTLRGKVWYSVVFSGRQQNVKEEDLRLITEESSILDLLRQGAFGDEKSFSRLLTMARINEPVRDTIYSYQASRTDLHGYQYKPLLKYLSSPSRRILIADEVGLGKTIEAGYIFQEERARHDLQRVLIVCPAALRHKWQEELGQRFGERFEILNASLVRKRLLSQDQHNMPNQRLFAIVSYETIRSRGLRERLEDASPDFDLLIADEIHHCRNRDTHNFRVMEILTDNSDSVVFLSATPVHTGNDNLFNLMNLLLPERFELNTAFQEQLQANRHVVRAQSLLCQGTPEAIAQARTELDALRNDPNGRKIMNDPFFPLLMDNLNSPEITTDISLLVETQEILGGLNLIGEVFTRTRKREVRENSSIRSAFAHTPPLTEYEQYVYDTLSSFIFEQYEKLYNVTIARFVLTGLQRQISSSLYAAVSHYRSYIDGLDEHDGGELDLDIEEVDYDLTDSEDDEDISTYRLKDDANFINIVRSISLESLYEDDSKFDKLIGILGQTNKAIIFAFYKRSLHYLQRRLSDLGITSVLIDGDVPSKPEEPDLDERLRRIKVFRDDPNCRLMLSSQVGCEGLDFQFCDTIINWDLPWNPMVVEQRIGRIDRLGQLSLKIFIHNLVSKGTIEELILRRLYWRIGIFKDSIGELEPILGAIIKEMEHKLFRSTLTLEEKEKQIRDSAYAVERERKHLNTLEKHSAQLIGHDELIRQKIEKIRHLGRFLSGKELEIFVDEFLKRRLPASQLYDQQGKAIALGDGKPRWLHVSPELREFVAKRRRQPNVDGEHLANLLRREEIKLVFDSKSGNQHRDAELIHSHHPLVRLIADFYESESDDIHRVNALQVTSDTVEPGVYFYGWASIDERGAFTARHLLIGLTQMPEMKSVDNMDECERVLHEMVVNGQPWSENLPDYGEDVINRLYGWLEEHIAEHVDDYSHKRNREAEAMVLRQLQSMEASLRVKIARREKAIETLRLHGKRQSVISLQQNQINKLQADFELKSAKLQARKTVDVSYTLGGSGFLKVNAVI